MVCPYLVVVSVFILVRVVVFQAVKMPCISSDWWTRSSPLAILDILCLKWLEVGQSDIWRISSPAKEETFLVFFWERLYLWLFGWKIAENKWCAVSATYFVHSNILHLQSILPTSVNVAITGNLHADMPTCKIFRHLRCKTSDAAGQKGLQCAFDGQSNQRHWSWSKTCSFIITREWWRYRGL